MSIICTYVRIAPDLIAKLAENPDSIFDEQFATALDAQVIDIDKAYDGLAWLVSPLKRAETAHNARVMSDRAWANEEARASVAKLKTMPVEDALAAIEGRTEERVESIDLGMGAAAHFPPERVRALSAALNSLSEDGLRTQLDFRTMDQGHVQPDHWAKEGEDLFKTYLLPALKRLQAFYATAADKKQSVLVLWT